MSKFRVGDRVVVIKNSLGWSLIPVGLSATIAHLYGVGGGYRILVDNSREEWNMLNEDLELVKETSTEPTTNKKEDITESTNKKIKQSLLRLCLSSIEQTIKSEKIIDYVKQDIGTDYKFGDTILRALRQLRQDRQLDYEVVGEKKDRNYKLKKV